MSAAICPAPECCSPVATGKFLCRPHWFALPKPIRDQIHRTWRAYQRDRTREALAAYRTARDTALGFLAPDEVAS